MGFKIGRILEQAREERGLSLQQVEQATKIRARYLKELELENFDVLPAVYVQGSLRTYADYLGLDPEALVRELKYRQASRAEPQRPMYGEPSSSSVAGSIFPAADLAGSGTRSIPEEKRYIAPTPGAGSKNRLYLGSAAMAFASTLATPSQSQISQVRKPLASQVPDGDGVGGVASLIRSQSDARSAGGEKDGPPPKRQSPDANAEEKESGRNEPSEENQDEPGGAQDSLAVSTVQPSTATATAMATGTATATATATAGASQATVITDSPPEPTVPPPEPPEAETAPPAAEAPAPETAAGGPGGGAPGRRIVVVVVQR